MLFRFQLLLIELIQVGGVVVIAKVDLFKLVISESVLYVVHELYHLGDGGDQFFGELRHRGGGAEVVAMDEPVEVVQGHLALVQRFGVLFVNAKEELFWNL